MRVVRSALLFVCASGSIVTSCAHRQDAVTHEWSRPAPRHLFHGVSRVAAADILPVVDSKLGEASQRLQTDAALRLSPADASRMAGFPLDPDAEYVLVRGLCSGCGTGKFSVYAHADYLIVSHLSLGLRGTPPRAWPVVVKVGQVPTDVYVQYSVAQ